MLRLCPILAICNQVTICMKVNTNLVMALFGKMLSKSVLPRYTWGAYCASYTIMAMLRYIDLVRSPN